MSRLAIVTGAASGIGAATVSAFLIEGWEVIGIDLLPVTRAPGLTTVTGDVAEQTLWDSIRSTMTERGNGPDALILAAAQLVVGDVLTLDEAQWRRMIEVNLMGPVRAARALLPVMIKRGGGAVVTVGSVDSLLAEQGLIGYCATKGALLQFTRTLALDHARDGIRANIVCPGVTDTPFFRRHLDSASDPAQFLRAREQRNPVGRLLTPNEVAATILFLAGPGASGITGASLVVDAGLTAGFDFRMGAEGA